MAADSILDAALSDRVVGADIRRARPQCPTASESMRRHAGLDEAIRTNKERTMSLISRVMLFVPVLVLGAASAQAGEAGGVSGKTMLDGKPLSGARIALCPSSRARTNSTSSFKASESTGQVIFRGQGEPRMLRPSF